MAAMRTLYTTVGDDAVAVEIARALLARRVAACVNRFPVQSVYRWGGAVQDEPEVAMLVKTTDDRLEAAIEALEALHPYDVPCIEVWEVGAVPAFAAWVVDETGPATTES